MSSSQHRLCAALLTLAAGMAGCAGNGEGLNANGLPIDSSSSTGGSGRGTGSDPGGSSASPINYTTLTMRGAGGGALADLNAQVLGSDYSFTFTVDTSP